MFGAHKGSGSYLNNTRMRVSNKSEFRNSCLVTGGPKSTSKIKESILDEYKKVSLKTNSHIRKSGSAALDLAYVAAGRYDGYWQREINYWDIAAGIILVKECGGFINPIKENGFKAEKIDIIATNTKIHEDLIKLL